MNRISSDLRWHRSQDIALWSHKTSILFHCLSCQWCPVIFSLVITDKLRIVRQKYILCLIFGLKSRSVMKLMTALMVVYECDEWLDCHLWRQTLNHNFQTLLNSIRFIYVWTLEMNNLFSLFLHWIYDKPIEV